MKDFSIEKLYKKAFTKKSFHYGCWGFFRAFLIKKAMKKTSIVDALRRYIFNLMRTSLLCVVEILVDDNKQLSKNTT